MRLSLDFDKQCLSVKVLIIEDELPAVKRLERMILQREAQAEIVAKLDSVESAVRFLRRPHSFDLVIMDIQLADGLSFDIFQQVNIDVPVIFTTAYDQYTLRAFKVNSIDYLLKPIDPEELTAALDKFRRLRQTRPSFDAALIQQLIQSVNQPEYRERFLVRVGQQITYVNAQEMAYFFSEEGMVYARSSVGKKHHIDYTLDQLEQVLQPRQFFRVNRKIIVCVEAIQKIAPYFNGRFVLELRPRPDFEVIVSRDRAGDFKAWIDR
jgi:DNA-binding LytR/AlgR family response regulator